MSGHFLPGTPGRLPCAKRPCAWHVNSALYSCSLSPLLALRSEEVCLCLFQAKTRGGSIQGEKA